jgi:HEAT repeat protein
MSETAERLLVRVLEGNQPDGGAANDLLSEFYRGYPVGELRRLLTSRNEHAVATGAFIAGELGAQVAPLQDTLIGLAQHPNPAIRCDVVGALHGMKDLATPESAAMVIAAIEDADLSVRWRAIRFLGLVGDGLLRTTIPWLLRPDLKSAVSLLVRSDTNLDASSIMDELGAPTPLRRRVALAAAIRVRQESLEPLRFAASNGDAESRELAAEFLAEWTRADRRPRDN